MLVDCWYLLYPWSSFSLEYLWFPQPNWSYPQLNLSWEYLWGYKDFPQLMCSGRFQSSRIVEQAAYVMSQSLDSPEFSDSLKIIHTFHFWMWHLSEINSIGSWVWLLLDTVLGAWMLISQYFDKMVSHIGVDVYMIFLGVLTVPFFLKNCQKKFRIFF